MAVRDARDLLPQRRVVKGKQAGACPTNAVELEEQSANRRQAQPDLQLLKLSAVSGRILMARAPFQAIVFPFRKLGTEFEFAALRRADDNYWQAIAGGGELGESPLEAAIRESGEEAGISSDAPFFPLQTTTSIPRSFFDASHWPEELYVVPEYAFAVDCSDIELKLSGEHSEVIWDSYSKIREQFRWDSNRVALWELKSRLDADDLSSPVGQAVPDEP